MANVIQFTIKGIDKFSGTMGKVGGALKKGVKVVAKFTAVASAAATAVVGFTTVVANGIDKTAKFATRIGKSVEELSKMQFAASQAGIANEQFNMATQRMTRRVSEAARGTGEAQTALAELGIDAKAFQNLGLEDQFSVLSDKISSVKNPADQLRISFKLFDSEGTSMLQMLKQGSPAMRQAARDAEYLGLAISEQAAANSEAFTDAMGRATGSMKGLSRGIAGELIPVITGMANRFADFIADNRAAIVNWTKNVVVNFFTVIEVVKQVYTTFKEIFSGNIDTLSNYISGVVAFVKSLGVLFSEAGQVIFKGIWAGVKAAGRIIADFGAWAWQAIKDGLSGKGVTSFGDTMAKSLVENIAQARQEIIAGIQGDTKAIREAFGNAGGAAASAFGINMESARADAMRAMEGLVEFGTVARDQINQTGVQLSEMQLAFQEQQNTFMQGLRDNSTTFVESLYQTITATIDQLSQGVAQAIVMGKSMTAVFQQVAKQVLTQVIATFVKMGVQRLLLSALTRGAVASEASAEGSKAVGLAAANGVASMAGAPFPLNLGAPAFGAAMGAAAASQFSAGIATGGAIGAAVGAAHGGLTNVPQESTYLLNRGERVLSPRQNKDLTGFLNGNNQGGGSGGSMTIESVTLHVLENVTDADAFLNMDKRELQDKVALPLLDAFAELRRRGIEVE